METLASSAASITTPIALAAFAFALLYLAGKTIVEKKIFPRLSRAQSTKILLTLLAYLFALSMAALVFGILAYVYTETLDTRVSRLGKEIQSEIRVAEEEKGVVEGNIHALRPLLSASASENQNVVDLAVSFVDAFGDVEHRFVQLSQQVRNIVSLSGKLTNLCEFLSQKEDDAKTLQLPPVCDSDNLRALSAGVKVVAEGLNSLEESLSPYRQEVEKLIDVLGGVDIAMIILASPDRSRDDGQLSTGAAPE